MKNLLEGIITALFAILIAVGMLTLMGALATWAWSSPAAGFTCDQVRAAAHDPSQAAIDAYDHASPKTRAFVDRCLRGGPTQEKRHGTTASPRHRDTGPAAARVSHPSRVDAVQSAPPARAGATKEVERPAEKEVAGAASSPVVEEAKADLAPTPKHKPRGRIMLTLETAWNLLAVWGVLHIAKLLGWNLGGFLKSAIVAALARRRAIGKLVSTMANSQSTLNYEFAKLRAQFEQYQRENPPQPAPAAPSAQADTQQQSATAG